MEYISKDDAAILIAVLNKLTYNLKDAKVYLGITDRLQAYIDDPDSKQIRKADVNNIVK